jgi:hypothetical protein
MKKTCLFLICIFVSGFLVGQDATMTLNGHYMNKNIYIENPMENPGFCVQKIVVNGKEISFEKTTAFTISLDSMNFKTGDSVIIEIVHKADCMPKILADNYDPKIKIDFTSLKIDSNAVIHWTTKNEINKLKFNVEQYKWNRWVKVGEVDGIGGVQENEYAFKITPHSGENRFRIKQLLLNGHYQCSSGVLFISNLKQVKLKSGSIKDKIEFDSETDYELYDQYGILLKKGRGKTIDTQQLLRGDYYVNYDNQTGEVLKE